MAVKCALRQETGYRKIPLILYGKFCIMIWKNKERNLTVEAIETVKRKKTHIKRGTHLGVSAWSYHLFDFFDFQVSVSTSSH